MNNKERMFEEILSEDTKSKKLDESSVEMKSIGVTAAMVASVLAIAFGLRACDVKVADEALNELGCMENYEKYNQDKKGDIFFDTDTQQKAMYAAVVANARNEGISIEKSAKTILDSFGKKLSMNFKSLNNFANLPGRIENVSVGKSSDGSRLVRIDYSWEEQRSSGSGENRHVYYVTKYGQVFIPESEANQYGIDDVVDNGHHSVNIGGATFEFDEAKKNLFNKIIFG